MSTRSVSLRPATRQDLDDMYRWRCDEDVYRWFRNQNEPLEWNGHVQWWQSRPDDRHDFIIELDGRPVGAVAIAADGDVGIYVGEKDVWGQGVATEALERGIDRIRDRTLTAQIHEENVSSQGLFEKVGFEQTGADGRWLLYEYPR